MATAKPLINNAGVLSEAPSGTTLDPATLGTGTPDGTKFLRDDGVFATPAGGGGGGTSNVFIQQTDPAPGTPYIWFQTDSGGVVIDILKG